MALLNNDKIKEILLKGSYITEEDIKKAEGYLAQRKGDLVDYLLGEGLITKDLWGQAIAEYFAVDYADLNTHIPSQDDVLKLPKEIGKKYRAIVYSEDDTNVVVATDNPTQPELLAALKQLFPKKNIELAYGLSDDIDDALIHYRESLDNRFKKIFELTDRVAPEVVIEIIDDAIVNRASDIHFEPQDEDVIIRVRIDGVLREAAHISKKYYENILNLIKVNAHMRIDQHSAAQDGSMRIKKGEHQIDLRVAVMPTLDGEKITIRILSDQVKQYSLTEIGLSDKEQDMLIAASKKPFGMILVTGPTGSGKTTTLYAVLRLLNKPEVNITTIEDPVEYKIAGVNHIQVNPQTNLTFAKGLRSIVRQDPDIILVGEIRDHDTAEIAVNAALTGHLLLSSFHANDAPTAIPRLIDMDVEPFLLSSTLELIIAQRLVRKICQTCRVGITVKREALIEKNDILGKYFADKSIHLYEGKGCKVCGGSGYIGRSAIFEFIQMTREMKDLILTNPSTQEIWDLAIKQGAKSLFEDGIEKVKNGITTIDEVLRVAPPMTQYTVPLKTKKK